MLKIGQKRILIIFRFPNERKDGTFILPVHFGGINADSNVLSSARNVSRHNELGYFLSKFKCHDSQYIPIMIYV